MRIVFDNRESGTTTGRYMDKLVEYLQHVDKDNTYYLLTKPHRMEKVTITNPNFKLIECDVKEFTFAEQIKLLKIIKSLEPDLVHFPIVQQPILYFGKTVTTMQDLTTLKFVNSAKNYLRFRLLQFVYYWVNFVVVRKSTKLISISNYTRDDCVHLLGANKSKFSTIYHSADELPKPADQVNELRGRQFIVFVGRHQPHKNLERLLRAHELLLETHPDILLAIVGKTDATTEILRSRVKDPKKVIFTGFVSDNQLRWLYENTSCYVFPSLSEGFGLPGLEAMKHGAPVASSNSTCLPEVYGDAPIYFDPLDVEDMARAIDNVLSNEQVRAACIRKGHEQAAKYSWQKTAEQTLEVYHSALSDK